MTKILKAIWNELIYGGHLLPLGAVSIVYTSAVLLGIKITWDCLIVVLLGMEAAYLYNRYKELDIDSLTNLDRVKHLKKNIKYIPFLIFLYIFLTIIFLIYFNKLSIAIFGFIIFVTSLLYTVFFKNWTKKIIGFKDIFIGLIWASLVFFLSLYYSYPFLIPQILIFIFICLRCFMGTSLYDIKDIESDKKEKLLTPAIVFGEKKLMYFLKIINILSLTPIVIGVFLGIFPKFSLMLLFLILFSFYFFEKAEKEKINIAYLSEIAIGVEKLSWSLLILIGIFLS